MKTIHRHCEERTVVSDEAISHSVLGIASSGYALLAMTNVFNYDTLVLLLQLEQFTPYWKENLPGHQALASIPNEVHVLCNPLYP